MGFSAFITPLKNTFKQEEKIKSSLKIKEVLDGGTSFKKYPILAFLLPIDFQTESLYPVQVAFTVSKKKFKRAVDRNKIKRYMRETYRTQKKEFYKNLPHEQQFRIVFVYIGKQIESFQFIEKRMKLILEKIEQHETNSNTNQ